MCAVDSQREKRFLLVRTDVCPEIFLKTVEAKKKIALYAGRSTVDVLKEVGIGKSAFYKYRDKVFTYDKFDHEQVVTLYFVVEDFSGILASIVNEIAKAGGNLLTINQNVPIGGLADVTIAIDTADMNKSLEAMLGGVCGVDGVRRAEVLKRDI